MRQHAAEPVERPQAAAVIVNRAEWLEGQPTLDAQLVPGAANGERRGPRGAAFVEQDDLRVLVAAELERQHRQQHRFAGAGRADHDRVADVADMERQPEPRPQSRPSLPALGSLGRT
jgi:hypothetical protein